MKTADACIRFFTSASLYMALSSFPIAPYVTSSPDSSKMEWSENMTEPDIVEYLLQGYDKRLPPYADAAANVQIGIYVNSFDSISDVSMDFAINFYLRQNWTDPRLELPLNATMDSIKLEDDLWNRIWMPDVFFRNEKKAKFHHITVPNRLLRIHRGGFVWYAAKITAVLSCPMNLKKYPLDTQKCPMMFESFGFTTKTVDFTFLEPIERALDKAETLTIPQFQLIAWEPLVCTQNYSTGTYPCLQVNFVLKRDIGYFLIQMYIPTTLIVILSWVSFWINADAIPARVSLGLLTVLTMTTQAAGSRSQLPKVSYIKAYDVWMSVCLVFVFSSLLEFAVVNVYSRNKVLRSSVPGATTAGLGLVLAEKTKEKRKSKSSKYMLDPHGKAKARRIDKCSRKVFPAIFLLFNLVYWTTYLNIDDF